MSSNPQRVFYEYMKDKVGIFRLSVYWGFRELIGELDEQ